MTKDRDLIFIIAVTVLALVLRLWHINADLWIDEIQTLVKYMRLPPFEAVSAYHAPNQHFLNSFLGSISIRLLGESVWSIRLPAMLFGVATIPVFFKLAMLVSDRREAIFSTLFLTFSYHHVWFSQNARGYSAMIFFTVLSSFFLIKWLNDSPRYPKALALGMVLCGCLGILSLLNYAFVVAGQFLAAVLVLLSNSDSKRFKHLLMGGLLVLLLTLLSFNAVLPEIIDRFSQGGPWGFGILTDFIDMLINGLTIGLGVWALLVMLVAGIVAITGWVGYWRRARLIAWLLVLPPLFNIAALMILGFGWFPRSFLYVLPFGILIVIRGAFMIGQWAVGFFKLNGKLVYVLPVLLLAASAVMLSHNYRYPKQDHQGSLAYTRSVAAPNDVIAVVGYLAYGYKNYYAPGLAFPRSLEQLEALRGPDHRVWVLYSYTGYMKTLFPEIFDRLNRDYSRQRVFPGTLGDGTVYLVATPEAAKN